MTASAYPKPFASAGSTTYAVLLLALLLMVINK